MRFNPAHTIKFLYLSDSRLGVLCLLKGGEYPDKYVLVSHLTMNEVEESSVFLCDEQGEPFDWIPIIQINVIDTEEVLNEIGYTTILTNVK
jgi:hypothetical protein